MSSSRLRIVVAGMIAQHPLLGGMTWHYLQYLLGLNQLGHDVYYLEDTGRSPYSLTERGRGTLVADCSKNLRHLSRLMERFGFGDRWAYSCSVESRWFGLSEQERARILGSADLLINVSGTLEHPDRYRQISHLCYLDTDPIVTQIKMASGRADFLERVRVHDSHFSFGESLFETEFAIDYAWRATRQPIVVEQWRPSVPASASEASSRENITTIMSWTSYAPLTHAGRTYGQKDVEFERFLDLPSRVAPTVLEVAIGGTHHKRWQVKDQHVGAETGSLATDRLDLSPSEYLSRAGWRVVDAVERCGDLDSYRHYIQSSKAEWSVAKNFYVQGQPGWFSERSACYLAAGRPVMVQDTGFSSSLPVGDGILSFKTLTEAVAAVREVEANYALHAEAAGDVAEAYFDSDKVLGRLIDDAFSAGDRTIRSSWLDSHADQIGQGDAGAIGAKGADREGRFDH